MLNSRQQQAVFHEGNLLIVAGPGTGKTHTLSQKIVHHLSQNPEAYRSIFAVTFTTKAARELAERIQHKAQNAPLPFIGTFHALGLHFLRQFSTVAGFSAFTLLNEKEQFELFSTVALKIDPFAKKKQLRQWQKAISLAKNELKLPSDQHLTQLYKAYQAALTQEKACDFDDLLLRPLDIFQQFYEIREQINQTVRFLYIDEYQDINEAQFQFMRAIFGPHTQVCAIGDPDQAIYAFRGSRVSHFLRFQQDFPDATLIHLEENYRSTPQVLKAADTLIALNTERLHKNLAPTRATGESLLHYSFENPWKEANFIVREIQKLAGGTDMLQSDGLSAKMPEKVLHFSDVAILFRTKERGRILQETLRTAGLPYQSVAQKPWHQQPEIQKLLLLCRLLINPRGDLNFQEILPAAGESVSVYAKLHHLNFFAALEESHLLMIGGLTDSSKKTLLDFRYNIALLLENLEELSPRAFLLRMVKVFELDHEQNQEYITLLLAITAQFDSIKGLAGLSRLIEYFTLLEQEHSHDHISQKISLLTIHAAKGLEFSAVFVIGLEDTVLPLRKAVDDQQGAVPQSDELEEERRLLYVALTRAKDRLYLSSVRKYGEQTLLPSPFLQELNEHVTSRTLYSSKAAAHKEQQMSLW